MCGLTELTNSDLGQKESLSDASKLNTDSRMVGGKETNCVATHTVESFLLCMRYVYIICLRDETNPRR